MHEMENTEPAKGEGSTWGESEGVGCKGSPSSTDWDRNILAKTWELKNFRHVITLPTPLH